MERSIYSCVNQDHLKTLAQKNKNNPMVLITSNILVLNMPFTFPFIVSFLFFFFYRFTVFSSCVNYNDKSPKKKFLKKKKKKDAVNIEAKPMLPSPPQQNRYACYFHMHTQIMQRKKTVDHFLVAMQLPHVANPVILCSRHKSKLRIQIFHL